MKEMSLHKIIVGVIGFLTSMFVLISLTFMVFGYDVSVMTQGASGFDLISGKVSTSVAGVGVQTPLDTWLLGIVGTSASKKDSVGAISVSGTVIAIVLLVAALSMMILSIVSLFFFSQKRHNKLALSITVISPVLSALLMIYGIVASSSLNGLGQWTDTGVSTAMYTKAYIGFIMVSIAVIGKIVYGVFAKKKGFEDIGFKFKKAKEVKPSFGENEAKVAPSSKNVHDLSIELLRILKQFYDKKLYSDIEFKEEKQNILIAASNNQTGKMQTKKYRLEYLGKYFDLMLENIITLKEFEYIKRQFS